LIINDLHSFKIQNYSFRIKSIAIIFSLLKFEVIIQQKPKT